MSILTNEYLNYNPSPPSILYHYCSIRTLLSIIENKCLWMSDAKKTNDKTERKWLFSEMKNVIDNAVDTYKNEFSAEILKCVIDISNKYISNFMSEKAPLIRESKDFLVCFSEDRDLLSQWIRYGDNGQGVAIGFNTSKLKGFSNGEGYNFTKVIYNQEKMKELLRKSLHEQIKWAIQSSFGQSTDEFYLQNLKLEIGMLIAAVWQEGLIFKNYSFFEEKEWRITRRTKSSNFCEDEGVDDYGYADFLEGIFGENTKYLGEFTRSSLKFRSSNDNIRAYFELGFERCKERIIKEIVIGPKCEVEELDIKLLLTKNKYITDIYSEEISLTKSNCPYI